MRWFLSCLPVIRTEGEQEEQDENVLIKAVDCWPLCLDFHTSRKCKKCLPSTSGIHSLILSQQPKLATYLPSLWHLGSSRGWPWHSLYPRSTKIKRNVYQGPFGCLGSIRVPPKGLEVWEAHRYQFFLEIIFPSTALMIDLSQHRQKTWCIRCSHYYSQKDSWLSVLSTTQIQW